MAESTKIEWTDKTFNPWQGCQKVSPGCDNCYAEALTKRFGGATWGPGAERLGQSMEYWAKPHAWNVRAEKTNQRKKVFCGSIIDVFDNQAPEGARDRLWQTILWTPMLDWQLLTKRPENIKDMLPDDWGEGYPNVWLGISAEDQERYDHRWPILAEIPAMLRFVLYEPALGPLSIQYLDVTRFPTIWPDWVIAGGESGPGAREPDLDWFMFVKAQCWAAGIPFFFKQMWKKGPIPDTLKIREFPRL